MTLAIRKLIELVLPWLVEEHVSRRLLYGLYGICTAVLAWGFVMTNPVFGWVMAGAPLALVWLTSRTGLAEVNAVVLGVLLALTTVPAAFLGLAQVGDQVPTGTVLVAFVVFVVWVAAYPPVLDHVDRGHRRRQPGAADLPPGPNPAAAPRVLLVKLWLATVVMLVVDETFAAVICVVALLHAARWTALVAAVACLVLPLFSIEFGQIGWDAGVIDVLAALVAADQWLTAARTPGWAGGVRLLLPVLAGVFRLVRRFV